MQCKMKLECVVIFNFGVVRKPYFILKWEKKKQCYNKINYWSAHKSFMHNITSSYIHWNNPLIYEEEGKWIYGKVIFTHSQETSKQKAN